VTRADRPLYFSLLAVVVAAAALAFGPFLARALIAPLGSGVWLLARALVLSVDQAALWSFAILAAATLFACRLVAFAAAGASAEARKPEEPNSALSDLKSWRYLFAETPRDSRERAFARRELSALLRSAYAARNGARDDYELFVDFREGRIPLPGTVRSFLFAEEEPSETRSPAGRARSWMRRASGRERADYLRVVEDILGYIEGGMEKRDE
jgi:hypothetical protein